MFVFPQSALDVASYLNQDTAKPISLGEFGVFWFALTETEQSTLKEAAVLYYRDHPEKRTHAFA